MLSWRAFAISALALAGCGDEARSPAERLRELGAPNLVLCVVDTLRADVTAPYGGPPEASPEIARWAAQGVVFERVLAQSSWTKTSMASLLTSLWPRSHGVAAPNDGLGSEALTLAEVLQAAGWRTYAVQSNGWLEQTFAFQQGFDRYSFPSGGDASWMRSAIWPHADNVYLEAARLLAKHPPDEPFFLYLHFMDVHEYAAPPDIERIEHGHRGAYLAALRWVDEVLERVRHTLADEGLLDRTVILLASDHGEAFGEHGVMGHARSVSAAETRVPLVLRWPFSTPPQRVRHQVRNVDIAPTLLDVAGVAAPASFEGASLLPLLEGGPISDRASFASLRARLYPDARLQDGLSDGRWHLIRDADGTERLYDRDVDPEEHVDLASIEEDERRRLSATLDAHEASAPLPGAAESGLRIDPELAQRLRALGYGIVEDR
jgi:arylsulfatase A-like enzyme